MDAAALDNRQLDVREAYAALERFADQCGRESLLLLMHASVPETLRPDLLGLIRQNFLPMREADSSLDADVLFSPLVLSLGDGYYRIDGQVRWHCLALLRSRFRNEPRPRARQVAELLWCYVEEWSCRADRSANPRFNEFIEVQRWVAVAFLEPDQAAQAFASVLQQGCNDDQAAALLRIGGLASAIELPLAHEPSLLAYARGLDALVNGDEKQAHATLNALGDDELQVGQVALESPRSLLARYGALPESASVTATPPDGLAGTRKASREGMAGDSDPSTQSLPWQLVVDKSDEQAAVLMITVEAKLQSLHNVPRLVRARSLADAERALARRGLSRCSLVVVGSLVPKEAPEEAIDASLELLEALIARLKQQRANLPVVIVTSAPDKRLTDLVSRLEAAVIINFDSQISATLSRHVGTFHDAASTTDRSGNLQFDIHLGKRRGWWQISRNANKLTSHRGELSIDNEVIDRVLFFSREIENRLATYRGLGNSRPSEGWLAALRELSMNLSRLVFEGSSHNVHCWETFSKHVEEMGGMERARIRITVDEQTRPMLVEALRGQSPFDSDFFVLRAPIVRGIVDSSWNRDLLDDLEYGASPINCLVIEGDSRGGSLPYSRTKLAPLVHLGAEATGIMALLHRNGFAEASQGKGAALPSRARGWCEHFRLSDLRGGLQEAVHRKLNERSWDLVHFCGHVISTPHDPDCLVLGPGQRGLLPIKALAARNGGTKFFFVSGCGGNSVALLAAAEKLAPAVLGFRWPVDDEDITAFAHAFYAALFDESGDGYRDVEYAVFQARRAAYALNPNSSIWLASTLSMQAN